MRVVNWKVRHELDIPHDATWLHVIVELDEFKRTDLYLLPLRNRLVIKDKSKSTEMTSYFFAQRFDNMNNVLYERSGVFLFMNHGTLSPDSNLEYDHIALTGVRAATEIQIKCRRLDLSNMSIDDAKIILASAAPFVVEIHTIERTRKLLKEFTFPNLVDAGPNLFEESDTDFVKYAFRFPKLAVGTGEFHGWKDSYGASPEWLFYHTREFFKARCFQMRTLVLLGLKSRLGHDVVKVVARMIGWKDVSMDGYQEYLDDASLKEPQGVTRHIFESNMKMRLLMQQLAGYQEEVEHRERIVAEATEHLELSRKRLRQVKNEMEKIIK